MLVYCIIIVVEVKEGLVFYCNIVVVNVFSDLYGRSPNTYKNN